jgi:hypothetical protein
MNCDKKSDICEHEKVVTRTQVILHHESGLMPLVHELRIPRVYFHYKKHSDESRMLANFALHHEQRDTP